MHNSFNLLIVCRVHLYLYDGVQDIGSSVDRNPGSFATSILPFGSIVPFGDVVLLSIVHEAFCRFDSFGILNGELINGSFDHNTSLTCVRIHFD